MIAHTEIIVIVKRTTYALPNVVNAFVSRGITAVAVICFVDRIDRVRRRICQISVAVYISKLRDVGAIKERLVYAVAIAYCGS